MEIRSLRSKLAMLLPLSVLVVAAVACGGDGGDGGGNGGTASVELQEWAVTVEPATSSAGDVTFSVENVGAEVHEFVVIKTDLGITDLPTEDDGSVSEDGEGMEVVDEIEDISPDDAQELTVDLEAGNYVLICNIVEEEDGEVESHYQEGMRSSFTVE
jgi:uncharacterized cupredoxin-like copper-binding protein